MPIFNGITHTYFTDGYFGWGKLFVESFIHFNDMHDNFLILSTRNLKQDKIDELKSLHEKIIVYNEDFKYGEMAKRVNVDKQTLLAWKRTVEKEKVNKECKSWKLMVAAEDRLKEIRKILNKHKPKRLLHVDVDTYVRGSVTPIFDVIDQNVFTTRWRIEKQIKRDGYIKYENRATLISVQGYKGLEAIEFLNKWIELLDEVNPADRVTGFGQTTCYRAYLQFQDRPSFKWGQVGPEFLAPQGFSDAILWGGNKGHKGDTLKIYQKHFKENK
jgi:DNA-binding XRE family transcriptional regulator